KLGFFLFSTGSSQNRPLLFGDDAARLSKSGLLGQLLTAPPLGTLQRSVGFVGEGGPETRNLTSEAGGTWSRLDMTGLTRTRAIVLLVRENTGERKRDDEYGRLRLECSLTFWTT